jgi:hypothetical protein
VSVPFAEQVAAVTPLNGVIDGSPKPKPRPAKPLRRERMDASRTFFCRNANCDHATWSEIAQARHMHAEFVWAMEALVMRAPESPEAQVLTGGVILAELTDDELRAAKAAEARAQKSGITRLGMPVEIRLRALEYDRRRKAGILTYADRTLAEECSKGHQMSGENLYVSPRGVRGCRQCSRERELKRRSDPAVRERRREQKREEVRKRIEADPAYREQRRERERRRLEIDPVLREKKRLQSREWRARKKAEATEVT